MDKQIEILLEKMAQLENKIEKLKNENVEMKKEIEALKNERFPFFSGSSSLNTIFTDSLEDSSKNSSEVLYDDPFDKNPLNTHNPFKRDYRVNPPSFEGDGPFC